MRRLSSSEEGESSLSRSSTSVNPQPANHVSSSSAGKTKDEEEEDNGALAGGEGQRLHLWKKSNTNATNNNGNKVVVGDVSLREWLDKEDRPVDFVQCLHIFRQITEMVSSAHQQGVAVQNIRPSCLVMSSSNHVTFIESASSSMSMESGSDSYGDVGSDGQGGRFKSPAGVEHPAGAFERASATSSMRSSEGQTAVMSSVEEQEERKSFPLKHMLITEFDWYISPEEAAGKPVSLTSDVYRLGVLLFELLCTFSSMKEKFIAMSNLRHRVLPPQLLLRCPKESSFCLWLLHPQPSNRPKICEVLKSDFLNGLLEDLNEHDAAIRLKEEIEEQELLLEFLLFLQRRKKESVDLLQETICCLSSDIDEVLKKQSVFKKKAVFSPDIDNDESSAVEREGQTSTLPERLDDSEISASRKRFREVDIAHGEEAITEGMHSIANAKNMRNITSKSFRLMSNFRKLESAYFLTRYGTNKPIDKSQIKVQSLGTDPGASVTGMRTELSSVDNLAHRKRPSLHKKSEWMNPFLDGLCKYLSFSKFNVCGQLELGDLLSSSNLVCSVGFDRDKKLLATAGVNRKIKIFDCDTILNEEYDIHYPVVEMRCGSKFSNICWNSYIKNRIASSDFEGVVRVWDVTRSQEFAEMREHEKRVWSVDFSLADPTTLASGSDDGTVKLWNINQVGSHGTIKTKANVCSVQFSPDPGRMLAVGSADHKIYCYDIRTLRIPWCTLIGHTKTVSYVKFVDSSTLVSASTDNSLKLWDLSMNKSRVIDNPVQTFTGHTNVKNFVGLSIYDGYIATGSETNEVFVYHKAFPMPLLAFKFGSEDDTGGSTSHDDSTEFVSSVCWRGQTPTLAAANSSGSIKLLEMV